LLTDLLTDLLTGAGAGGFAEGGQEGGEQEFDEGGGVPGLVAGGQDLVVFGLTVTDDGFHGQEGKEGFHRLRMRVCQSRPMRPLPSAKGWMNSSS
jgi:hypothetical protein